MQGIYLNEIPIDTFLKYFDENTVNQTKLTPIMTPLQTTARQAVDWTNSTFYYMGNMTSLVESQLSGLLTINTVDIRELGNRKYNKSFTITGKEDTSTVDITISKDEKDIYSAKIEQVGSTKYENQNIALVEGYFSESNSEGDIEIFLSKDKLCFAIKNYIWDEQGNGYYCITNPNAETIKKQLFFGFSSTGVFLSFYQYSALIDFNGEESFIQMEKNTDGSFSNVIGNRETFTFSDLSKINVRDGISYIDVSADQIKVSGKYTILGLIENKQVETQAKTPSGEFKFRDDIGMISLGSERESNFRRHQKAIRASYYDIESMDDCFIRTMEPYTIGCIQRGTSYTLGYYEKYFEDKYYYKKPISGDMNPDLQSKIFDKNSLDNADYNSTAEIMKPNTSSEFRDMIHTINTAELPEVDVIYNNDPRYTKDKYLNNILKVNIEDNAAEEIDETDVYLMNSYIQTYKLFKSSIEQQLPLSGTIPLGIFFQKKEQQKIKTTADYINDRISSLANSVINALPTSIQISLNRKANQEAEEKNYQLRVSTTISFDGQRIYMDSADSSGIDNIKISGRFKIYNTSSSNPYILIPIPINEKDLMINDSYNTGYLARELKFLNEDHTFSLVQNGSNLYLEDDSNKTQYPLYNTKAVEGKFSFSVKIEKGALEKDEELYMMQFFLHSVTKESTSPTKLIGFITNTKSGVKSINKYLKPYSYSHATKGLIESDSFKEKNGFKDILPESEPFNSLNEYLKYLVETDNAPEYSIVVVNGMRYYIKKTSMNNLEDTTAEIILLDVFYNGFSGDSKEISFSTENVILTDVISEIYLMNDAYYFGRKDIVDEKVYYNNKKKALKNILMKVMDNPYEISDITEEFIDANRFDEIRVYAAGLYSFLSNDRAKETEEVNSIRNLTSIDDISLRTIYERKPKENNSLNFYEPKALLNWEEKNKLDDFAGAMHILKHKEFPTSKAYLDSLLSDAKIRDTIENTEKSSFTNSDLDYYQNKVGNFVLKKDLAQTYEIKDVEKKDFSNALAKTIYEFATKTGIQTEMVAKSYKSTLDLIAKKVSNAKFIREEGNPNIPPTEKFVIDSSDENDMKTIINLLAEGDVQPIGRL